jgi:hypothetical protein
VVDGRPAPWLTTERTQQFSRPRFSGVEDRGLRVLVWAEQGVGDEVMFGTMLGEFRGWCGELLVEVDARLRGLFERSFGEGVRFFSRGEAIDEDLYDVQIPMGSLGLHLRPDEASFRSGSGGYLKADEERGRRLRESLGLAAGERLVGLSWRSSSAKTGAKRSVPLVDLVRALRGEGVRFVNLQYGAVGEDLAQVEQELGERVLECEGLDVMNDLDGLSSLIVSCDEVVTVGNATAHLAGALGKDAEVLLPYVAEWRWMHEGERSVWYESLHLLRQQQRAQWDEVLVRCRREISVL